MKTILALVLTGLLAFEASAASTARSIVQHYAARYGVPLEFALRVARKESGVRCGVGRHYAGPLQISYRTAISLGYRGTAKQLHRDCNAATNYGMKHLSIALRLAKGNQRRALCKHQRGLGARC